MGSVEEGLFAELRDEFVLPTFRSLKATAVSEEDLDKPCTYLCGNSLGLMPKRSKTLVEEELAVWGTHGVEGHFANPHGRDWWKISSAIHPHYAKIVGAKEEEVACMGTLTANLHLMLSTFYKPTAERYKILCEAKAFPSDQYAFASQTAAHGFTPADAVLELSPREGEFTLREEDIIAVIEKEGPSIALVLFAGCQYYTGQVFPMQRITAAAQKQGCICGWDLAHGVGNVPLSLHDWNVDFAVWCTYKYLNSGPGGIAGLFVHEKWNGPIQQAGWWGHDPSTRFAMPPQFSAIPGAQGFQQSNPSVFTTVSLLGSLQVFDRAGGMKPLRERSIYLTGRLEKALQSSKFWIPTEKAAKLMDDPQATVGFTIITPKEPESRGSQLSLLFFPTNDAIMPKVQDGLMAHGVIGDTRKPDVIRLAPCALYNSVEDVDRAVEILDKVLASLTVG